jgi:hypothetical protein
MAMRTTVRARRRRCHETNVEWRAVTAVTTSATCRAAEPALAHLPRAGLFRVGNATDTTRKRPTLCRTLFDVYLVGSIGYPGNGERQIPPETRPFHIKVP